MIAQLVERWTVKGVIDYPSVMSSNLIRENLLDFATFESPQEFLIYYTKFGRPASTLRKSIRFVKPYREQQCFSILPFQMQKN